MRSCTVLMALGAALMLTLGGCGSGTRAAGGAAGGEVAAVRASERARFAATVARDTAALRPLLHPDLLYIHSNANEETAAGYLASVATGRIRYLGFEPLRATRVVRLAGGTALADGLVRAHGTYEGGDFAVTLRYTSVYADGPGGWQLLRWQSTGVE